jgi:hypothetical protein
LRCPEDLARLDNLTYFSSSPGLNYLTWLSHLTRFDNLTCLDNLT